LAAIRWHLRETLGIFGIQSANCYRCSVVWQWLEFSIKNIELPVNLWCFKIVTVIQNVSSKWFLWTVVYLPTYYVCCFVHLSCIFFPLPGVALCRMFAACLLWWQKKLHATLKKQCSLLWASETYLRQLLRCALYPGSSLGSSVASVGFLAVRCHLCFFLYRPETTSTNRVFSTGIRPSFGINPEPVYPSHGGWPQVNRSQTSCLNWR
jgi:hypothetical protein